MEHSPIALSRLVGLLHLQPETSASAHGTVILAVTCGIALLLSPAFVCRGVEVMKVQQYGCFVALESRTQGLVHVCSWTLAEWQTLPLPSKPDSR